MGRTRTKTRKTKPPTVEVQEKATSASQSQPSVSSLLEKAQELIVQCDYELAGRFVQRVLERSPDHAEALEMMGVVQLETGELDAARKVCQNFPLHTLITSSYDLTSFFWHLDPHFLLQR